MAPFPRKNYAIHPHIVPRDAIYESRRASARVRNELDEIIRDVVGEGGIDEVYKEMLLHLLAVEDGAVPRKEKVDDNDVVEQRTKHVPPMKRKRKDSSRDRLDGLGTGRTSEKNKARCVKKKPRVIKNLVKKEKQCDRTNGVPSKKAHGNLHHEDDKGNISLIHNQSELVARAQPVKIYRKQVGRKLKGVVKEEYEANKKVVVKKENEKISQDHSSRNYCKDVGQAQAGMEIVVCGKAGLIEVKKECDHPVETRLGMGGIHSRSMAPDSEVEILDHDMVVKGGIFSPFISSKKFHSTMSGEKSKNLPSAKDEFRKELLKVLRKPFDQEEYKKCQETIRAGPFLKHHRGVQKRLTKYRFKREKRLVIMRGFFFWVQNLTREGAFRPWKDEECMAVQLPELKGF